MRSKLLSRSHAWRGILVGVLAFMGSMQMDSAKAMAATPWEECSNQCYATFSADVSMCRRYNNIQDEEICTWFWSQTYDACMRDCDEWYGEQ